MPNEIQIAFLEDLEIDDLIAMTKVNRRVRNNAFYVIRNKYNVPADVNDKDIINYIMNSITYSTTSKQVMYDLNFVTNKGPQGVVFEVNNEAGRYELWYDYDDMDFISDKIFMSDHPNIENMAPPNESVEDIINRMLAAGWKFIRPVNKYGFWLNNIYPFHIFEERRLNECNQTISYIYQGY